MNPFNPGPFFNSEYEKLKLQVLFQFFCPKCYEPSPDFMRGQVQSSWRRFLGMKYCAVICRRCRKIIGWEKPKKRVGIEGTEINEKLKETKRMSETMPNFEEITKINTLLHEDDELHKKIREAASQMRGNEQKILDDFCKAYYAAESKMTGKSLMSIIKDVRLNVQQFFKDGQMGTRYWFELKEDEDGVEETN